MKGSLLFSIDIECQTQETEPFMSTNRIGNEVLVNWKGSKIKALRYSEKDLPRILDIFFFWKTAVLLATNTESKKPQLPETFSEPFTCLISDLVHKRGKGPDAFRLDKRGETISAIEIKASITKTGFTDIKRDLDFDELLWLSFASYENLKYKIFRFARSELESAVANSNTRRDRGTINLMKVAKSLNKDPDFIGRIGVVPIEL